MSDDFTNDFYSMIFANTLDGIAFCKIIFDERGKPSDWTLIKVSDSFEALTGIKGAEGKRVTELVPGIKESNPELFEIYGRVAAGGAAERFETYVGPLKKWFLVSAYSPKRNYFIVVFQNVTEGKEKDVRLGELSIAVNNVLEDLVAERKILAETNAKDEALLASIGEGIVAVDRDGKLVLMNRYAEDLLGYSAKDLVGKSFIENVSLEDAQGNRISDKNRPIQVATVSAVPAASDSVSFFVRKDGTRFPAVLTAAPVFLGGKASGAVMVFRDMRLFEVVRDGVMLLDAKDGRVSSANPFMCEMIGADSTEIVGKPVWEMFSEGNRAAVRNIVADVRKSGSAKREDLVIEVSGRKPVDVEFSCSRYVIGRTHVIQCNAHDISERRELQRKLASYTQSLENSVRERTRNVEEEKSRTLALLENIPDGVMATDINGNVTHMNFAAETMLRRKAGDTVGRIFQDVCRLRDAEGSVPLRRCPLHLAMSTGRTVVTTLEDAPFIVRDDGSAFPAIISAAPMILGKVIGGIVVFHDVTREKEIDRVKSEFISIASHQLRTPLSTIAWYSESLLAGHLGPLTEAQRKYTEEIAHMDARMIELVNALLSVSRIDLGTFKVVVAPVRLSDIADTVLGELAKPIADRNIRVVRDYDGAEKPILADANIVHIVFQNLLSNAVVYNRLNGSITVRIRSDGEAHVSVSDTGCGIPRQAQSNVFGKFYRADNAREIEPGGTGIGLYIVRSLLRSFGGSVWFESEENKGSTFHALIPTAPPTKANKR